MDPLQALLSPATGVLRREDMDTKRKREAILEAMRSPNASPVLAPEGDIPSAQSAPNAMPVNPPIPIGADLPNVFGGPQMPEHRLRSLVERGMMAPGGKGPLDTQAEFNAPPPTREFLMERFGPERGSAIIPGNWDTVTEFDRREREVGPYRRAPQPMPMSQEQVEEHPFFVDLKRRMAEARANAPRSEVPEDVPFQSIQTPKPGPLSFEKRPPGSLSPMGFPTPVPREVEQAPEGLGGTERARLENLVKTMGGSPVVSDEGGRMGALLEAARLNQRARNAGQPTEQLPALSSSSTKTAGARHPADILRAISKGASVSEDEVERAQRFSDYQGRRQSQQDRIDKISETRRLGMQLNNPKTRQAALLKLMEGGQGGQELLAAQAIGGPQFAQLLAERDLAREANRIKGREIDLKGKQFEDDTMRKFIAASHPDWTPEQVNAFLDGQEQVGGGKITPQLLKGAPDPKTNPRGYVNYLTDRGVPAREAIGRLRKEFPDEEAFDRAMHGLGSASYGAKHDPVGRFFDWAGQRLGIIPTDEELKKKAAKPVRRR